MSETWYGSFSSVLLRFDQPDYPFRIGYQQDSRSALSNQLWACFPLANGFPYGKGTRQPESYGREDSRIPFGFSEPSHNPLMVRNRATRLRTFAFSFMAVVSTVKGDSDDNDTQVFGYVLLQRWAAVIPFNVRMPRFLAEKLFISRSSPIFTGVWCSDDSASPTSFCGSRRLGVSAGRS